MFEVCVCYLVRERDGRREVLLGRKKTGLGVGKIVGLGGKLEPGESALDAIIREVKEESGVTVRPSDLRQQGRLRYTFPYRESWSQASTVFVAHSWVGEPAESEEIDPQWYPVTELPLEHMWDDAAHWLPAVLDGKRVDASFVFAEDCASVSDSNVDLGAFYESDGVAESFG